MTNTNDEHIYIVMEHVGMYGDAHSFPVNAFTRYEHASRFVCRRQAEDDKWREKANRIINEWGGKNHRVEDIIIAYPNAFLLSVASVFGVLGYIILYCLIREIKEDL